MNGVHDMGGLQDMGPLRREQDEPIFHSNWERRIFALFNAVDVEWPYRRHQIELIPPADYLRLSYYEKWLAALPQILMGTGMATAAEIESGKAVGGAGAGHHVLTVAEVATWNVPDTSPKVTAMASGRIAVTGPSDALCLKERSGDRRTASQCLRRSLSKLQHEVVGPPRQPHIWLCPARPARTLAAGSKRLSASFRWGLRFSMI